MRLPGWFAAACVLLVQGCAIPRFVTIHDGLRTTIIDAGTREPIANALVFARRDNEGLPVALARSNNQGQLRLEPERKLQFIMLLSESQIFLTLSVCKDGYVPYELVTHSGWNADFRPSQINNIELVELNKSVLAEPTRCKAER